jgi:hypothetical protein
MRGKKFTGVVIGVLGKDLPSKFAMQVLGVSKEALNKSKRLVLEAEHDSSKVSPFQTEQKKSSKFVTNISPIERVRFLCSFLSQAHTTLSGGHN